MNLSVNIGELKNRLSEYLERVERGDEIEVCKRNVPIATISGVPTGKSRSRPGWARGTVRIVGELEGPVFPAGDWNMLRDDFDLLR
jgi:prevent-host-death family protein